MDWTLEYNGTTQTFAAWGLEGLAFSFAPFATGSATFSAKAAAFDAAAPFARGSAGIIRAGETVVFRGNFGPAMRKGEGTRSELLFTLRDAWHDLERRFWVSWQASKPLPQMQGFLDDQYEAIIDHAQSIGVAIQFGTAANLAVQPPEMEFKDMTFAAMLKQLRRFVPDVAHYFDYSTTPPTIHFVRRADATALTLPTDGANAFDALDITSLEDLQTTGVLLRYTRLQDGETPQLDTALDLYPIGTTGEEDGAVVATFDLRGNQVETQRLITTNISPSSRAWWSQFYEWLDPSNADLDEGTGFGFVDTARKVQNESGEWVLDSNGLVNQVLPGGAVPGWMAADVSGNVLVLATLEDFTLDGEYHETFDLRATVPATSLAGGVYVRETVPGESVPSGLAQAYYNATSVLHYQGQASRSQAELSLPLPHPANVFNLSGGLSSTRGWDSMRAVARAIEIDVQNASLRIAFGPPEHLGPQDMLELARMAGHGRPVIPPQEAGATTTGGVRLAASSNTMPQKPVNIDNARHPLYIVQSSGEMVAAVVNGSIIPRIGSTAIGIGGGSLSLSGDGWVYLRIKVDLTFHSTTHFLQSWAIQATGGASPVPICDVVGSTTVLTDGIEDGVLTSYQLVAQIVDGIVQRPQVATTNYLFGVCDLSDGTAEGKAVEGVWTPA